MKYAKFDLMPQTFGDLIREARLAKGWSQRELARRIKKSPTYVHYAERGLNPSAKNEQFQASVEVVDDLADALDLNRDEVRLAAGYAPIAPDDRYKLPEGVTVSFDSSSHLSDEQKDKVVDLIRTLVAGVRAENEHRDASQ
jgi:transcriptional regulator with XRE-family HTH domain